MKKVNISLLLILILKVNAYSQLGAMIEKKAAKTNFNKALKGIEETPNRYFLKTGNEKYIGSNEEDFLFEDNNMYADIELSEENLKIIFYRYYSSKKAFSICSEYHNSEVISKIENSNFTHLNGDVYVSNNGLSNLTKIHDYVLFNKTKGLYFHLHKYEDQNRRDAFGGGFYKKTKDEKVGSDNIKHEESKFSEFNTLYENAIPAYEQSLKRKKINAILSKSDEGVSNAFHKQNLGQLLFSNNLTEQNKFNATTYKSKFTIDEGINVCLFLDKALKKCIDTSTSNIEENLTDLRGVLHSKFYLKIILNDSKSYKMAVYAENPAPSNKTSGIFPLVLKNASTGNNNGLKDFMPQKIDTKELKVQVELLASENSTSAIANGSFIYIPKAGAVMPYGPSCNLKKDVNYPHILKLKPRLLEIASYSINRYNKKQSTNYSFVSLSLSSDWQKSTDKYGMDDNFIYVEVLCKDSKGDLFLISDRFSSPDKTDGGYFTNITQGNFPVFYCDK